MRPNAQRTASFQAEPVLVLLSFGVLVISAGLAASRFPEPFDWAGTVVSALASRKHNPGGGQWFAGGIILAVLLLWPVVRSWGGCFAQAGNRLGAWSCRMLEAGVVTGALLGLERLLFFHFSSLVYKAHEILALVAVACIYAGVFGLLFDRARGGTGSRWLAAALAIPLLGVGISQLSLYLSQREAGWAGTNWMEVGHPIWLSFAFWQWMALALLMTAMGFLTALQSISGAAARELEDG